jgi:aspartate kinase
VSEQPLSPAASQPLPPIIVQKYGGSSVADAEKIKRVAERVARTAASGKRVCVVVSAMGDTTDDLLTLAHQIAANPHRRELDMLLSAGERISMALLGMALQERGVQAVSFTGSQSGIITDGAHTNARILEVRPVRILEELAHGKVVIVAGYQGVSREKEVTTLGRGGSDTTAVALAAALEAELCEICSDVDGVFTADPRIVANAKRLASLTHEEMQELALSGAKVLNAQAVEFARDRGITIHARSTFQAGEGTRVGKSSGLRELRISGVSVESDLLLVRAPGGFANTRALGDLLTRHGAWPRELRDDGREAQALISLENVHGLRDLIEALAALSGAVVMEGLAAVSLVGSGVGASGEPLERALAALASISPAGFFAGPLRLTFFVPQAQAKDAVRALHVAFVDAAPN